MVLILYTVCVLGGRIFLLLSVICFKFVVDITMSLRYLLPTQGGLPMYVASRGLYNLKPPTVFVPPCIKDDVEKLFEIHRTMGQVELNLDLVALDVGMHL